ncbi:two-component hybrid sensor and regulator [Rivularia sp. IAM M-261]|nr:two-component hybrid sensor and regulator [Rivularia sp. IAM M-261]
MVRFYRSSEAERIFGFQASEVTGNDFVNDWQFVFPDDLEAVMSVRNKLRYGIEQRNIISNRNYRKDGSVVYCEWYNSTLVSETGKLISVLSLVLDITPRVRLEVERTKLLERAQAAQNEAESANQIKDQFLAVLSHELRSPLNPILGWTKLLKSRKFDEVTVTKALDTIERNVKLQIQLIDDLLDVSRILRGKLTLHEAVVDLSFVIDAAIETVRLTAEAKSIKILSFENNSIVQVKGDTNRLQQIVGNLLTNAVKFTPNGGQVEVYLSVCNSQSISYAQIQVRDTGKGINPEFLPYVFEQFRQADSSTTRNFGGLGLGLAIVHHLVELHGGTVTAESAGEGQGATFTVNLPLISSPDFIASNSNSQTIPNLEGIKILIVDDEADTREFLAFLLQQYGAIVTVAISAHDALAKFSDILPNILLSDLGMSLMDGYSLIRQIRTMPEEQGGQIPAIALTAFAADINKQQVLAAGFNRHIAKPVEPLQLVTLIASVLEMQ